MVTFVVGSVQLVRWLRNRKIARTEEVEPGRVLVILENGDTLDFPPEAVRLALDADYRRNLRAIIQPLASQAGVTRLTVTVPDAPNAVATVASSDLAAFEVPPAIAENFGESDTAVVLRPVNVAFTEGNKWRFSDGDTTFYAAIEDSGFLQAVDLGAERFAKSDMLRVRLRTRQYRGTDGELHTERAVVQVLEHIQGGVQLDLFANETPEGERPPAET